MKKTAPLTLTALVALLAGLSTMAQRSWSPLAVARNLIASPAHAATRQLYHIRVDGMTCPFCAATSEKALKAIPGVRSVSTNLKKGLITVCASPSARLSAARMKTLFAKKGFTFRSMSHGKTC